MTLPLNLRRLTAILILVLLAGCARSRPPNVLFIVWDTVRADHMSLYGYAKATTPNLDRWAAGARVFDDCQSTASSTVPSHAAMFTGLVPSEHGASFAHLKLDDQFHTVAEIFQEAGYRTFLFAANPHISRELNFTQGFEVAEHPWDGKHAAAARRILLAKLDPADRSSELPAKLMSGAALRNWDIKATGEIAETALKDWLQASDAGKPWFAVLNYMEAHRPHLPPRATRARVMSAAQVERSYQVDRSWLPMWAYSFGLHEYPADDLEVMTATYDATLIELDQRFQELMTWLEASGQLDSTIVVLTADHGEHLGEHHMLDHQYSLYQGLIRVPLVIRYPAKVAAGRESRPVANFDLYPTLPVLAGLPPPPPTALARSLLEPRADRRRLAEYTAIFTAPFAAVSKAFPQFDPTPFQRQIRSLTAGPLKLISGSDGRHELFDLESDAVETQDLFASRAGDGARLSSELKLMVEGLQSAADSAEPESSLPEDLRERLKSLGYVAH